MAVFKSFDKKRIAFVGNSFTFYGKCVNVNAFDGLDDGYFYQLARSLGDDVTVTNFTWGGASFWHKGSGFAQRLFRFSELLVLPARPISLLGKVG